jgi:hypothetical protein
MSTHPDVRTILPAEVKQPGLYIPLPSNPEALDAFGEVRRLIGQAGLYGFDVEPDNDGNVLPYDPEEHGSLGLVGYQEVMDYFKPIGLETARDYAAAWRPLRGTSARIARDEEKWIAYQPLGLQKEQLLLDRDAVARQYWDIDSANRASSRGDATWDRIHEFDKVIRGLDRQIRKIRGSSQSLPSDPIAEPFIYVASEWDESRPLSRSENKVDDPTYVPDESTVLHLDNLHSNASSVINGVRASTDMRINILLAQLLNDRIAKSLMPKT